jgi:HEPN domain-containing protein
MSDVNRSIAEARALRYLIDSLKDKNAADALIRDCQYDMALFHITQLCEKSTKACLAINNLLITEGRDSSIKEHLFSEIIKTRLIPISNDFEKDLKNCYQNMRN